MKILVVDDGQLAINSLIRILCRVAPDCDYISAMTTDDALTWLRQGPMDAAFLNLEMPGMNGLEMCKKIRETNNIPIIMLSAKSTDLDKILGLGTGADDYVVKPFSPKELMMRQGGHEPAENDGIKNGYLYL